MSKILVIDDDAAFRGVLATMLEKQGLEVLQAASGAEGVQLARTDTPSLILCDVELGGVGGNLVLYAVRRDCTASWGIALPMPKSNAWPPTGSAWAPFSNAGLASGMPLNRSPGTRRGPLAGAPIWL